jgi:hypothetical protein
MLIGRPFAFVGSRFRFAGELGASLDGIEKVSEFSRGVEA